ncbi:hypothetical protein ILUMI_09435 [Ignelater luminosus]|uniref:Uncharacterized protein n=1 Tax=Ignelater luminosus TaxID=2038154 RepID=A0A8K0CZZ7_IGNLU|nr:hypothetical protein ILUMI_09435 [Ignelater luminosus]
MNQMQRKPQENETKIKPDNIKKRKPPIIRQTLTSMYRIAKANPLLIYNKDKTEEKHDDFGLSNIKLPKSVLHPNSTSRSLSNLSHLYANTTENSIRSENAAKTGLKPTSKPSSLSFNFLPTKGNTLKSFSSSEATTKSTSKYVKQQILSDKKAVKNKPNTNSLNTPINRQHSLYTGSNMSKMPTNQRRSLSAEHYDCKRGTFKPKPEQNTEKKKISSSLDEINKKVGFAPIVSPVIEENSFEFKLASANKRRSVNVAFLTPTPFRRHCSSTPRPAIKELQERLHQWLRQHKKPVENYKHLKCFGVPCNDEENKENVEDPKLSRSTSYEDLKIIPDSDEENKDTDDDNRKVAHEALSDLHKLICDGYPTEQCELWLGMIRQKCEDIEEEYKYWECRAAVEQARGNIISAVDCLRSAIVQGAEVKAVDESLEQLLQKFSLLNINTAGQEKIVASKNQRTKIVLDARTVFKSSIIQFAVQERALKKKQKDQQEISDKKYLITPVRRSTRRSRSGFTSTPGIQICASLQELDKKVCDNSDFRINNALADSFRY